jgi:hypothetical protein
MEKDTERRQRLERATHWTIADAAFVLGLDRRAVRQLVSAGLPVTKLRRRRYVRASEVRRWAGRALP